MIRRLTLLLLLVIPLQTSFSQSEREKVTGDFHHFVNETKVENRKVVKNKLSVMIGDSASNSFEPFIKLNGFENQSFLKISLNSRNDLGNTSKAPELFSQNKRFFYDDGFYSHEMFLKDSNLFEWEIILYQRPDRNIFTFDIETESLVFAYQDSLSDTEKLLASRPDSVCGSYAVYHKGNNGSVKRIAGSDTTLFDYQTGKLFHIYRPKIWDSKGDSVWGDIEIDTVNSELKLSVAPKYLDEAVYPVTIDPTIGYTSMGASEYTFANFSKTALLNYHQTMNTNAILDSAYMGIVSYIPNNEYDNFNIAVYTFNSDSTECTYLTDKSWDSYPIDGTEWKRTALDGDTLLADSAYTLAVSYNNNFFTGNVRIKFDTYGGWGDTKYLGSQTDFVWPSDLGAFADYAGYRFSAYLVYTEIINSKNLRRRRLVE